MLELFPGPLRQYAEAVAAGPPAPADIAIAALGSSPAGPLARALQLSAAHHGSIDSRVTGSVWTRHGFSSLLPGVVAAAALAHHVLPLRDAAIRADRRGRAVTLLLPHGGEALHRAPPHQRYGPLLDDLLAPLVQALAAASGASPRLLWANAGAVVAEVFRHAPALLQPGLPATEATLAQDAAWLMDTRTRPDGRDNPLHAPMRAHRVTRDGTTTTLWLRRLCCLRHRLHGFPLCGDCPRRLLPS
ncbi:siderophore-iron reductase FhuF [Cupriavidus sp. IK-TO18]|uniref:siderophore-iron reductase FhuF n=1 Tax=Cupriavidus sp. IK-TO18 TaxID=2782182 RepID=UPI001899DEC8|nr:siderophore-iron reductase FhuF [Cupriavidus sp. IK-TO18]MBF6987987.1 siderophore-iron reductase FhuF [Cupriavidus sp. IK-TO18]